MKYILRAIILVLCLPLVALADPIGGAIALVSTLSAIATAAIVAAASYGLQAIVSALTRPKPGEVPQPQISVTTADEGQAIARIYGTFATGGHCIARGTVTMRTVGAQSGGKKSPGVAGARVPSMSFGFLVCENIDDTVLGISRIWLADELMYERPVEDLDGTNPPIVQDPSGLGNNYANFFMKGAVNSKRMQILLGQSTQTTRCSWFYPVADDGPGYRGYVTVWFDDMDVEPTHTLMPQLRFEVVTTANVYTTECKLAGLTDADLDLDFSDPPEGALAAVDNWFVLGPTPPKQTFQSLAVANPYMLTEADGFIKGFYLPTSSSVTVPEGHLAAIAKGRDEVAQAEDKPVRFTMSSELSPDTPRRVVLKYYDASRAYEAAAQGVARSYGSGDRILEYSFNSALARDNVNYIAARTLGRLETERDQVTEAMLPKYIQYHPGDTLTLPLPNGQFIDARIDEMEIGPGQPVTITSTRQLRLAGLGEGDGSNSEVPPGPSDDGIAVQSVFILSNVPPLVDADDGFDGCYWAAGPSVDLDTTSPPSTWNGAALIRNACGSDDSNKQYYVVATTRTAAVIGKAKTVLANGSGVDSTNTVDISLPYGDGTTTLLGILNCAFVNTTVANLCVLGGEVMQFRDITDVSASYSEPDRPVIRISQLKRGLRDTSAFTSTHAVNDAFFLYDPEAVIRVNLNVDEQDNTWSFKSVTSGLGEGNIDNPMFFTLDPDTGNTMLQVHTTAA